jgi:hypothetical protein
MYWRRILTRRTKILSWFIALALVMACAPSMATPVPPLDTNAINTVIVLTAGAASTQTVVAIPPTATLTSTPRSTFTPEPTSTLVPTIIFPTSTLAQKLQYFRVKHDTQLAEYNYKSRTAADGWSWGLQTPEVVSLFHVPKLGSGTNRTILDSSWEIYIDALNDKDKQKLRYLKADNTALFDGQGFPSLESKTMGGNVITLDEVQGTWGRVHTLDFKNPGALKDVNYVTNPDLIQKMVVVKWDKKTKRTSWIHPPPGPIYWPLVSDAPVWVPLERLEPFPALPMMVSAKTTQEIKTKPETKAPSTGEEFAAGASERIIQYHPSGSSVWAKLSGGGWIVLFRYDNGPSYPTTWQMETLPPP